MRLQNFKMPVSSIEDAQNALQILFNNGYTWSSGKTDIDIHRNIKALYVKHPLVEYWSSLDISYPTTTDVSEITYEEFIGMYVEYGCPDELITKYNMFKFVDYCIDHINDEKTKYQLFNDFLKEYGKL